MLAADRDWSLHTHAHAHAHTERGTHTHTHVCLRCYFGPHNGRLTYDEGARLVDARFVPPPHSGLHPAQKREKKNNEGKGKRYEAEYPRRGKEDEAKLQHSFCLQ